VRRVLVLLAIGLCALAPARAPPRLPVEAVKIIVGTSPGGSPDVFARLIAQQMSESWGAVVIENRIGATATLPRKWSRSLAGRLQPPTSATARSGRSTRTCTRKCPTGARRFRRHQQISTLPTFLTVHPSVPATTYAESSPMRKEIPASSSYASAATARSSHHHGAVQVARRDQRRPASIPVGHVHHADPGERLEQLRGE